MQKERLREAARTAACQWQTWVGNGTLHGHLPWVEGRETSMQEHVSCVQTSLGLTEAGRLGAGEGA